MDDIRYIYIMTANAIEEAIDEKQTLFEEMFYFLFSFSFIFSSSDNLLDLLSSVYKYYIDLLSEINREHDIYDEIKKYIRDMDDDEIKRLSEDEDFISDMLKLYESIDTIVERRILNHSNVYGYYKDLLASSNLNNKYYKAIKFNSTITEEKKNKFLSLIPRG